MVNNNLLSVMEGYEVVSQLGKGACGAVFLVKDVESKRHFALKKIELDEKRKTRTREAVLKEAKILATLKHPNIVAYRDSFFDKEDEHLCIVQDYCDGGTLDEVIQEAAKKGEYFPEKRIMEWFIQLSLAVQHMHMNKILHRDLKAQNVFMTKSGAVKLGDFGISKTMENTIDVASTCVGTPCYLSPELCQDIPYSSKADIWSLGCLLYEMCALRPAFDAHNLISLFYKIVKGEFEPIPSTYSEAMSDLLKSILNKVPEERPSARGVLLLPYVKEQLGSFIEEKEQLLQQKTPKDSPNNSYQRQNSKSAARPRSSPIRRMDVSDAESGQESQGSSKKARPQSSRPTVGEAGESGKPDKKAEAVMRAEGALDEVVSQDRAGGDGMEDGEYSDDFDEDDNSSSVSELEGDIPEELSDDGLSAEESDVEYDDDFEEYDSTEHLDKIVSVAREAQGEGEEEESFYDNNADPGAAAACRDLIKEHCIDSIGQANYDEMKKYCENAVTAEDLKPMFEHMVGSEHMETCYLLSEILTEQHT